jgi:hypothetical protein
MLPLHLMNSPEQPGSARNEPSKLSPGELPSELKEIFKSTDPGFIPTETDLGIVHICHAAARDLDRFTNKTTLYQWQLALMPTAPVLRLSLQIIDQTLNPYKLESFLNMGLVKEARVVATLGSQQSLYLAFYGQDITCRFTKVIGHNASQRDQLHRLASWRLIGGAISPRPSETLIKPRLIFNGVILWPGLVEILPVLPLIR